MEELKKAYIKVTFDEIKDFLSLTHEGLLDRAEKLEEEVEKSIVDFESKLGIKENMIKSFEKWIECADHHMICGARKQDEFNNCTCGLEEILDYVEK